MGMIAASSLSRKRSGVSLIVAARRFGGRFKCRAGRWSGWPAFAFERGTATIAFDIHLEDRGVMDEAIDDGERHCLIPDAFMTPPFLIAWCVAGEHEVE
jgi:hypothetical protein